MPAQGSGGGGAAGAVAQWLWARAGDYLLMRRNEVFEPARGDPTDAAKYAGAGTPEEASHELFSVVTEVNIVHLAITVITVFITVFGMFSGFVKERLYVGEAIVATMFGVAFSGYAAGIFAPRTWDEGHHTDEITLELTRIVIALSVFAVGVELPRAYVLRHWKSLAMLLGPLMFLGWMTAGALMYAIIPGLEFLPALVLAAGVTPTDPILASSVVGKGKYAQEHVPSHIRHILQAESGCNDGAAFPFLYLALMLLLRGTHSVGETVGYWILLVLLYQIILGIIIGGLVGVIARKVLKFSKRRELIDRESMVAMYVALSLLVTALTTLAGSDDLLAAFACGTAFAWDDWFTESIEESNFSSTIDLLANSAIFIYIGATMPFASWSMDYLTLNWWRLTLLCLSILAFRRLPAMYALWHWIPDIKTRREAIFSGHFGPMGVGAIFISTLAATKLPTPTVPPETVIDRLALMIVPVTYCIVLTSILVHGLTISFFTLGRRMHSRVQSFSRTLTANSTRSGYGRTFSFATSTRKQPDREEPSWMARVKRATRAEDIIINRDEEEGEERPPRRSDESPESLAEKGRAFDEEEEEAPSPGEEEEAELDREEAELEEHAREECEADGKEATPSEIEAEIDREVEQDTGTTAMFGAPPNENKVGAGQREQLIRERREAKRKGGGSGSRAGSRRRRLSRSHHEADADAPGDREEDVAELGGTDLEKEVETADDVRRGETRAERHREQLRIEREREANDHPRKNILGELGEDEDDPADARERYRAKQRERRNSERRESARRVPSHHRPRHEPSRRGQAQISTSKPDPRKEARYCRGPQTWQEGRKIIVDHGDGNVDVIDHDASPEDARRASKSGKKTVFDVPPEAIEKEHKALQQEHGPGDHEESAVKRVAAKMIRIRQSSAIGGRIIGKENSNLSAEEKERRRKERLERDAWCRRERKYRDSSPDGRGEPTEWLEGDKVVIEYPDGRTAVRDLTEEERRQSAKKHLAALHSLGHYSEAMEAEFSRLARQISNGSLRSLRREAKEPKAAGPAKRASSPPPRRFTESPDQQDAIAEEEEADGYFSPASEHRTGLPLDRTERIEPPSDDEEEGAAAPPRQPEASTSRAPPPGRRAPVRQGSAAMQAVRGLFRPRANTAAESSRASAAPPTTDDSSPNQDQNGNPSIRFATQTRPDREGSTAGNGRPLPVVGGSMSVRRVPSRRVEDQ